MSRHLPRSRPAQANRRPDVPQLCTSHKRERGWLSHLSGHLRLHSRLQALFQAGRDCSAVRSPIKKDGAMQTLLPPNINSSTLDSIGTACSHTVGEHHYHSPPRFRPLWKRAASVQENCRGKPQRKNTSGRIFPPLTMPLVMQLSLSYQSGTFS